MNHTAGDQRRVQFDFDIEFLNGGGVQGQEFRLDIDGEDIAEQALAEYIVRDLRLLMVGRVRILNKKIITEPHKRTQPLAAPSPESQSPESQSPESRSPESPSKESQPTLIELSHTIEDGLITYKGLPAPIICDHLSRVQSRDVYAEGTEFQIGRITMVANTGTYIDSPFHRYADGADIAALDLGSVAELEGVLVRVTGMSGRAIPREAFGAGDVAGKAVLVHTGWDVHWRTDRYFEGHPFLTAAAAEYLKAAGAALVGIDSLNIDDTADLHRPVHTILLGAGIPIVEHLCGLARLPSRPFRFCAAPAKVRGMGTFPVRAYAWT